MGCSGGKQETLERPGGGKLMIWGDFFNSDTRTLMSVLDLAGVPYVLQEVDTFKEDNKKPDYLIVNPSG
jgi:glutathione S-transferase